MLGEGLIQLLAVIVLEKGFQRYMDFKKSTYRCPRWLDTNLHDYELERDNFEFSQT